VYRIYGRDLMSGRSTTLGHAEKMKLAREQREALQEQMIRAGSYVDIHIHWIPSPRVG